MGMQKFGPGKDCSWSYYCRLCSRKKTRRNFCVGKDRTIFGQECFKCPTSGTHVTAWHDDGEDPEVTLCEMKCHDLMFTCTLWIYGMTVIYYVQTKNARGWRIFWCKLSNTNPATKPKTFVCAFLQEGIWMWMWNWDFKVNILFSTILCMSQSIVDCCWFFLGFFFFGSFFFLLYLSNSREKIKKPNSYVATTMTTYVL